MLDDHTLDELYAAIIVRDDFARVERILAAAFGTHCGMVMRRRGEFLAITESAGINPETSSKYGAYYHALDPWLAAAQSTPYGEIVTGSAITDLNALRKTEYYEEINRPSDVWDLLGMRIGSPETEDIFLCLYKPSNEVFTAEHRRLARMIMPHLRRAHSIRWLMDFDAKAERQGYFLGLTKAEQRIVHSVMDGRKNRELCDALSISVSTLKWHLRNIYQKVGVRSKAELIAKFASSK